jgi:hypothetical protein
VSSTADEPFVSIGQVVNIGAALKRELERIARQDFNADVAWWRCRCRKRLDRDREPDDRA